MYKTKYIYLIFFVVSGLFINSCHGNLTIKWWSSNPKKQWDEQRNVLLQQYDSTEKIDAEVFTDSIEQRIDGFGGCFDELGWDALSSLNEKSRNKVISMLFDSKNGLGFNICRMPIGANDFARNFYSLDDSVNDYSLDYFNIERDKEMLIPYIKAAMHYQKRLKIWGVPWTPPVWMKNNRNYACLQSKKNKFNNELSKNKSSNQILFNDTILKVYAKYFEKYIKAYEEENIHINAVYIQNEFSSCMASPSCTWKPSSIAKFIINYLGPRLEKDRIKTEIWFGTIDKPLSDTINSILENNTCRHYFKGLGFNNNSIEIIAPLHSKFNDLKLMQIENENNEDIDDWQTVINTFYEMKLGFNSGINSYTYNNMVSAASDLSNWGKKQNSLITIDSNTKNIILNPEYFLFKHFSYFIMPGSSKVLTKGKYSDILAFVTPDNNLIIIAANVSQIPKLIRIKVGNKIIETVISKNSINSFVYFNAV